MPADQLTNREIFQKLLDVVNANHKVQQETVTALSALKDRMDDLNKILQNKLWTLLLALIAALCAAVGIKLIFPTA